MKRLIVVVIALLVFLMSLAMLLPRKVSVAKTININAPQETIIAQVSDFKNWPHWFPVLKENLANMNIRSETSAILQRENGKNIDVQFLYKKKNAVSFKTSIASGAAQIYELRTEPLAGGGFRTDMIVSTTFSWYPWQRARTLFMDKITGPQYEEALKNLQTWCEGGDSELSDL